MHGISVIIPTYNGGKKLPNILKALEQQTFSDFEVIIVSDGSTDNTPNIIEDGNWQLNIIFAQNANQGRSATRNHGAALARNPLLVFLDDDMRPLPDLLQEHYNHHQEHTESIVTGGLCEELTLKSTDLYRYKAFLSNKWLSQYKSKDSKLLGSKQVFLTTANFSIPKKVFNALGGFNIELRDAEDFEFAVRAKDAAYTLYYRYKAFAWHDDIITITHYIKRQRQYYKAQKKLIQIHPDWPQRGIINDVKLPKGIKALFFGLFCNKPAIAATEVFWIKYVPKDWRYKYYDWVITANGIYYPERVQL
jgi:glycosyltransferase involved in cell wall biosynthesis